MSAPQHRSENDRADRQALDPSVGDHQQAVWQVLGKNAVLGRRVGRRTEAHHCIGEQRVGAEKHHQAAADLDRVADQHHPPFRHRVCKSPTKAASAT